MAKPQRAFALIAAMLLLGSSIAVTGLTVWQLHQKEKPVDPYANLPAEVQQQLKAQEALKNQQQPAATTGCSGQGAGDLRAVPEVFKPTGDVTALQFTDLKTGTGAAAKSGDCLQVKYNGTLATTGAKFDGNYDQPAVFKFVVGTGKVISGWDQGLIGMKVGGTRRLVIPSELAYGATGSGSSIPPNADLVFVVDLLKVGE